MKIALLGDMAFFGKYSIKNREIHNYFSVVSKKLKEYDHVVGNLETPFCSNCKPFGSKSAYINATEENIELLKYLNIDIVNLSNNHIFDYGLTGYEKTKILLEKYEVKYFGIENIQLRIDEDNAKVALSGFCCYSTNGLGYFDQKTGKGVNILNAIKVERTLIANHEDGYLNIASFHAGQEHVNYPNYDHVEMARLFAKKVPYVYYGHHPHVIQGIEEIEDSLIAYSLGNFCFDDVYTSKSIEPLIKQSEENKKSFILSLEIKGNKLVKYDVIPLFAGDAMLEVGKRVSLLEDIRKYSLNLTMDKQDYIEMRARMISDYLNKRKSRRDFNWYIKRLNFKSVGMIINAKRNLKKYRNCVTDYL